MSELYRRVSFDPDIFSIPVPFPNGSPGPFFDDSPGVTKCYLVHDSGEWLLVDTGAPSARGSEVLNGALDELSVDRGHLSVFLTHFHFDHAGQVGSIEGFKGPVYVSETDYRVNANEDIQSMLLGFVGRLEKEGFPLHEEDFRSAVSGIRLFDTYGLDERHMMFVSDGDSIKVGSRRLDVVGTSGHTEGHISLYEPRRHHFFGGDHVLYEISPSIDLFENGGDGFQAYIDSLRRVRSMLPFTLLPAHGRVREDPSDRIDWLIAHHEERIEQALAVLRSASEPMLGMDVISRLPWNGKEWENISNEQKTVIGQEGSALLDHLVWNGLAERTVSPDGLYHYSALEA